MSTSTLSAGEVVSEREPSWGWLAVAGAIIALLGILAILSPFVVGVSLSVMLGALLVVAGLFHVVHAFTGGSLSNFAVQGLLAVVYTFAGISLLANPVVGLASITLLLIAYFLVTGLIEIVVGIQQRGQSYWVVTIASGVISLLLAWLLWVGFPSTAAWALGLLVGVNLLATGIAMLAMAWTVRRAARQSASGFGGDSGLSTGR